jgi:hypothetical protein
MELTGAEVKERQMTRSNEDCRPMEASGRNHDVPSPHDLEAATAQGLAQRPRNDTTRMSARGRRRDEMRQDAFPI